MPDLNVNLDIAGAKEIGGAVEKITDKSIDGVGAFLGKICMPLAGEIGMLFADRISFYRQANLISYADKLQRKVERLGKERVQAHPRLVHYATEQASLTDDDEVQDLWAGLLAASCDETGMRQGNIIYMNVLSSLSPDECRIIDFIARHSQPVRTIKGVELSGFKMALSELTSLSKVHDPELINEMVSHLYAMEMVSFVGDTVDNLNWSLKNLGISFYVRCQGYVGPADDYFGEVPTSEEFRSRGEVLYLSPSTVVSNQAR